jgi:uncharacterized membrane protein
MGETIPWFRFLHILSVLWLVGGLFAGPVVRAQTRRSTELAQKAFGLRLAWRLTAVFVLPGLLLAGLLGFHLVGALSYPFKMMWIHISAAVWALQLLVTLFVLAPKARSASRAADASLAAGAPTPEMERALAAKLPGILWDVTALATVVVTLLMVLRPT